MKKKSFLFLIFLCSLSCVFAQPNPQQKASGIKAKYALSQIVQYTTISDDVFPELIKVFYAYYNAVAEVNSNSLLSAEGNQIKTLQLGVERDDKLKLFLTPAQMKFWIKDIEPELRRKYANQQISK